MGSGARTPEDGSGGLADLIARVLTDDGTDPPVGPRTAATVARETAELAVAPRHVCDGVEDGRACEEPRMPREQEERLLPPMLAPNAKILVRSTDSQGSARRTEYGIRARSSI